MFHFSRKSKPLTSAPAIGADTVRRHMVFHGQVQGVGFRYRAVMEAKELGLTGWVRNEYDGTVEMEAQGTDGAINELIEAMRCMRYIRITQVENRYIPVKEDERTFRETY